MSAPRLGVLLRSQWPPEEQLAVAAWLEGQGFDELWVAEDCFSNGGASLAAAALATTERVEVGLGLLPAAMRNAACATMEIATLARLHPGRLAVAFAHGVDAWMRQIDARPPDRLTLLEETVRAARELLAGATVTRAGRHVRLDGVALDHPPAHAPPVLVGTTGERGLRLAGRCSDGIVLPEGSSPRAVRWAREQAGERGRTVVYAWLSVEDEREAALAALRPEVGAWAQNAVFPALLEHAGLEGGSALAVDDDVVAATAAAGTPEECARTVLELAQAGADSVVLVPRLGAGKSQLMRLPTR